MGNLFRLGSLYLQINQLSGTVPPELANLSTLGFLILSGNQLTGAIPMDLGKLSNLQELVLSYNRLSGTIPSALGNLSNLWLLDLSNNQLCGEIPSELTSLSYLDPPYTDIGYNALYTSDPTVEAFLGSKDPDWDQTQTIAPGEVSVSEVTGTSVMLKWTPIPYTADVGTYCVFPYPAPPGESIFHDGFEGGNTEWWGIGNPWVTTTDKSDSSVLVEGLDSGTNYDFVLRTVTEPHGGYQQNQVISDPSATVNGTTSP